MNDWLQLERLCRTMRLRFAERGTLPLAARFPRAIETAADKWARKFCGAERRPPLGEPQVCSCLFVRFGYAADALRARSQRGLPFPTEEAGLVLERLLVDEWHATFREQWARGPTFRARDN